MINNCKRYYESMKEGVKVGIIVLSTLFLVILMVAPAHSDQHMQSTLSTFTTTNDGYVVFTSSGLPEGVNYTVHIDNKSIISVGSYLNLSLPYGKYSYSILLPYDYQANVSSGNVTISSHGTYVPFTVSYRSYSFVDIFLGTIVISFVAILITIVWYIKYSK